MTLAIFDLDQTLIAGDSDFLWGEFLTEVGAVDAKTHQAKNQYFFDQYKLGKLNINEFLDFALAPLAQYSLAQLNTWHQQFMATKIMPIILPKAQAVVDWHKNRGDTLLVITATNDFVTTPIITQYGIEHLLATCAEKMEQTDLSKIVYTGKVSGNPCFQAGKITKLKQWLVGKDITLSGSYFYSDSHNDLPLLELVDNPVAVHADKQLGIIARQRNWQIQNWQ